MDKSTMTDEIIDGVVVVEKMKKDMTLVSIDKWTDKDKDVNEEFVAGVVTKIKNNEITLDEYLSTLPREKYQKFPDYCAPDWETFTIMARCTEEESESDETGPEDFVELKEAKEIRKVVGAECFGDVETENSTTGNKADDSEEDWDDLPVAAPVNLILAGIDNITQSLHIAQIGLDNMKKGFVMVQKDLMKHVDS